MVMSGGLFVGSRRPGNLEERRRPDSIPCRRPQHKGLDRARRALCLATRFVRFCSLTEPAAGWLGAGVGAAGQHSESIRRTATMGWPAEGPLPLPTDSGASFAAGCARSLARRRRQQQQRRQQRGKEEKVARQLSRRLMRCDAACASSGASLAAASGRCCDAKLFFPSSRPLTRSPGDHSFIHPRASSPAEASASSSGPRERDRERPGKRRAKQRGARVAEKRPGLIKMVPAPGAGRWSSRRGSR